MAVPPEIKAAVVAALLAGEQPAVVAERYQLPPPTVRRWKQEALSGVQEVIAQGDRSQDRSIDRPDLARRPGVELRKRRIAEIVLDLLADKLEGSRRLTAHLSDPAFLATLSFEQLVALNGFFDRSALTLGDRLAGAEDGAGDGDGEQAPGHELS